MERSVFFFVVVYLATFVVISLIAAVPVNWLWNLLMPDLFLVRPIGFLEAWGLVLLGGCVTLPGPLAARLV